MEFIIGSLNNAKTKATQEIVSFYFPDAILTQVDVSSGVSNQPFGDVETIKGAVNRAIAAANSKKGSIGIGLEGGVKDIDNDIYLCNWGAFALQDGTVLTAGGAQIPLPIEIAIKLKNGEELGPVVDDYFKANDIRQREGAIGMFTSQIVNRDELFEHVLKLLIGQMKYLSNES